MNTWVHPNFEPLRSRVYRLIPDHTDAQIRYKTGVSPHALMIFKRDYQALRDREKEAQDPDTVPEIVGRADVRSNIEALLLYITRYDPGPVLRQIAERQITELSKKLQCK